MRDCPSILHLDLDAFFAAVEQRDKPSLRGKPVVVGGLGPRGVVSTASYEARPYGVHSAMPMAQARVRCPHAAFLSPRFAAYQAVSQVVLAALRDLSPLVEPLSLDEAFVDLADREPDVRAVQSLAAELRTTIAERTSVTASVGAGTSKLIAKIASEQAKPDGVVVVPLGEELDLVHPLPIRSLPGVGPATAARLGRLGVTTIGDLAALPLTEVVSSLGDAHGQSLHQLAHARDDRPVVPERESKSISIEDTFDDDVANPALLTAMTRRLAERVTSRLARSGYSGRTITLKARLHDFTAVTRSATLPGPTDDVRTISRLAVRLLGEVEVSNGVRLLGVGVSGLSDWTQDDLFTVRSDDADSIPEARPEVAVEPDPTIKRWLPGMDVVHAVEGPGWVWGSGLGRVTIRFETADTGPGPVRTFAAEDPDLASPVSSR